MDTQNKWFGVTKDLVSSAKALVQMAGQNPRVTSERKFVNLRRKIERYEKFVNRKLEEMITQSQDISVFDRPSINELSYTMTQYTQKSRANGEMEITSLGVEDYVPTDYFRLKEDLATASDPELSITILKGLIWRLLKSKDVRVRRLNIIGVLMHDTFGLRTGDMRELFAHSTLRMYTVRLMFYIGHDYYGRCALFSTELIKDIIQLLKMHYRDEVLLSYGAPILQNLSVREDMKAEMIELDLVRFFLQLLNQHQEYLSSEILENIVATLLNLCSRPDGIRKFEQEPEALKILAGLLEGEWVTRAITIGAIFTLLGSKIMHEQALAVGLQEIISYMIEHNNRAHINDLRCLEERLLKFEPIKAPAKPPNNSDDVDEIEEDSMMDWQDELESIEEFIKAHEFISSEYQLSYREAQKVGLSINLAN
jgi:protein-tyrosine phosphatase